jgi:hypothetical protein
MPDTWRSAFSHTVHKLVGATPAAQRLRQAFGVVARGWCECRIQDGPPIRSGVGPDGAPVELSVQWEAGRARRVRFIAQPGSMGASGLDALRAQVEAAREFVAGTAGPAATRYLDAVLPLFPYPDGPVPPGNFLLWLGLAVDPLGAQEVKLYVNPWATRPGYEGPLAIHHLLEHGGTGPGALRAVARMVDGPLPMRPHIFGSNLDGRGVRTLKVYFVRREVTRDELCHLVAEWCGLAELERCVESLPPRKGEVHTALEFWPGISGVQPTLRINLFCPEWFDSDLHAAEAGRVDARELLSILPRVDSRPGWRRFNFLGLDHRRCTFYFKLTPLGPDAI